MKIDTGTQDTVTIQLQNGTEVIMRAGYDALEIYLRQAGILLCAQVHGRYRRKTLTKKENGILYITKIQESKP